MGSLQFPQMAPRRPLKPLNSPAPPPKAKAKAKVEAEAGEEADVGEENYRSGGLGQPMGDVSLAEELRAARRRRERLRLERERTEGALREMELALERGLSETERREKVQRKVDLALRRLILLVDLQCFLAEDSSPLKSLREREREKKIEEERTKGFNLADKGEELRDKGSKVKETDQATIGKAENTTTVNESNDETTATDEITEEKTSIVVHEKEPKQKYHGERGGIHMMV